MKIIITIVIMLFASASLSAQERFDLFKQFMDKEATREDLRHLAGLLKESEFSDIARDFAKEYFGYDNGSLPRGWPEELKDSEKTVGELRVDNMVAIWSHHMNSSKPENYRILIGFLEEDWGYKSAKDYFQRYEVCWRSKLLYQISRFFRDTKGEVSHVPLKVEIIRRLSKVLLEDRLPNAAQSTILSLLFLCSDADKYIPVLLERSHRIRPLWKRDIFLKDSFDQSCFGKLSPDNKEKFLIVAFSFLKSKNDKKNGEGIFFARYLARMLGCDISKIDNYKMGENLEEFNQRIVELVLSWGKNNLKSGNHTQ